MSEHEGVFVDPTARVEEDVEIADGTRIWGLSHVRRGARIGAQCVIGSGVTVDLDVVIGDRCKVQNGALLFKGVRLEDGVFVGPGAVLTNDRRPRAVDPDGAPLAAAGWAISPILVERGASIGANATVVAGVRIGEWAMVGAGAVVTHDVPAHALVLGVPAQRSGWVCACGELHQGEGEIHCGACGRTFTTR
ncbi:MAG: N-acetyltransferase [Candidatus Dormibacteraeota bacterium]|nr:N-acetyltransferase [Candidatus Dormibacteraeota bacterium]